MGSNRAIPAHSQLQELHARGFVHCDLKPDNVLISATGDVKLGDLGLLVNMADGVGALAGGRGTSGYNARGFAVQPPSIIFFSGACCPL